MLSEATAELMTQLAPVCLRLESVGQRHNAESRDIRLLAVPKVERIRRSETLFEELVEIDQLAEKLKLLQKSGFLTPVKRERYVFKFHGSDYPVKLTVTFEAAWFASLVQTSSFRDLQITLATAAKNLGMKWVPSDGGFEDLKTGKVRLVKSEAEVFQIARLPYIPLEKRNRGPVFSMVKSGLPIPLTVSEMRAWVASVPWTDTWCGGEHHYYTFRTSGDERQFLRMCEFIRAYGHDGQYRGRTWRYLDLDGFFYFDYGDDMQIETILNRKKLDHPPHPWARNPETWIPLKGWKRTGEEIKNHAA